jgi:type IV secretory pathway VirB10-like protein
MLLPPVIVSVPKDTPKSPGPPPPLASQSGPAVTPPPQTAEQVPPPPPRKKKRRKNTEEASASTAETTTQQAAVTPSQQPAAQPAQPAVPQLTQVLSDDQQRDFRTHIHDSLDSATRNLGAVANRQLTAQQDTMRNQVVSFIKEAQEASKTDLVTARSLAERADLLSRDLRDSLQ